MKDYKIDAFNVEELQKGFDISKSETSLLMQWLENIIFQIVSSDLSTFYIYENFYDKEWFMLLINNKQKYIDTFWATYSEQELSTEQYLYEQWREYEDEAWNILVERVEFPEYKEIQIDWYDYSSGVEVPIKKVVNKSYSNPYFWKDDLEIFSNKKVEKLYNFLKHLWVEILWYSGFTEPRRQVDSASGALNEFGFTFTIKNKERFIGHCIALLEDKLQNTKSPFAVQKRQELLMDDIQALNEKYGTQWKNISIKNKNKTIEFETILILLHLKGKINIPNFYNWKEEYSLDILEYWKDRGIYFNEKNGEVFKNGIKLWSINLWTNPYRLFKYLYNNIWIPKTYEEIRLEGIWNKQISGEEWQYIHWIKKQLPNKEIKDVIEASNWQYIIRK